MNTAAHMVRGIFLLTLLASSPTLAQCVTPEEVGLSSGRLARVDTVIEEAISDGQVAGAVALINRHGSTVYHKSFGMIYREAGTPMQNDALFRIASMSKGITSTAIMILYEEGHFLLSDPVSKYIPAFRNPQVIMPEDTNNRYALVPAKREITIRMLLNHTSGITYGSGLHRDLYRKAGISAGITPTDGTIEEMILNNGEMNGTRILSRKTVELMTTNSIGDLYAPFRISSGDKFGYGFGIRTERGEYDELESLGIIGWDGAFYTRYWIDPSENLVAVLMTQAGGPGLDLREKYRVSVYQAIDD